jgi:Uma2 family endonuclease
MATASKPYYTEAEYLARERRAAYKSEYYRGEIFAMAGATREHNLVAVNVASLLREQLRTTDCETYPSDMRVRLPSGLYTYPDVSVACGEPRFLDDEVDTLLNPIVIVEVLSESTEGYDRGEKFAHYRRLPSLREYVLVSPAEPRLEAYARNAAGEWVLHEAGPGESLALRSLDGVRLSTDAIYHNRLG